MEIDLTEVLLKLISGEQFRAAYYIVKEIEGRTKITYDENTIKKAVLEYIKRKFYDSFKEYEDYKWVLKNSRIKEGLDERINEIKTLDEMLKVANNIKYIEEEYSAIKKFLMGHLYDRYEISKKIEKVISDVGFLSAGNIIESAYAASKILELFATTTDPCGKLEALVDDTVIVEKIISPFLKKDKKWASEVLDEILRGQAVECIDLDRPDSSNKDNKCMYILSFFSKIYGSKTMKAKIKDIIRQHNYYVNGICKQYSNGEVRCDEYNFRKFVERLSLLKKIGVFNEDDIKEILVETIKVIREKLKEAKYQNTLTFIKDTINNSSQSELENIIKYSTDFRREILYIIRDSLKLFIKDLEDKACNICKDPITIADRSWDTISEEIAIIRIYALRAGDILHKILPEIVGDYNEFEKIINKFINRLYITVKSLREDYQMRIGELFLSDSRRSNVIKYIKKIEKSERDCTSYINGVKNEIRKLIDRIDIITELII